MIKLIISLLIISLIQSIYCTYGVDISDATDISAFQCLTQNGYTYTIIRCYQSTGNPDSNAPHTIYNAWDGGMSYVDVYMFPCPTCSDPASQVNAAVSNLQSYNATYGMFWLDIEGTQYWTDQASNQAFFEGLVSAAQNLGLNIGVYSSYYQWTGIMGNSYTGGSSLPLWYAHYDNNPSFSDFSPFGGWNKPAIKQYQGDATVCNVGVDLNYY